MKQRFLALSALFAVAVATPSVAAPACTGYHPVAGDTLWDLAASRLNDPFKWTEIWKQNPQIHQPGRHYVDGVGRTIVLVYPTDCLKGIGMNVVTAMPESTFLKFLGDFAKFFVGFTLGLLAFVLYGAWTTRQKPIADSSPYVA